MCMNSLVARQILPSIDYQESLWMEVQLTGKDKLLIGCIYRSDSGTQDNNDQSLDLLNEMTKTKHSQLWVILTTGE